LALLREPPIPSHPVDGPVPGSGHQPGARVVRDAGLRPALQGDDQRILRQLLGEADVANHVREAGDQPRGLDPPDGVDLAVRVARYRLVPGAETESLAAGVRAPSSA